MARLTVAELIRELQESPNMDAEVHMSGGTNLAGSAATTDLITITAHGLVAGDLVRFVDGTGTGVGLTIGNSYFVIAAGLTANDFSVSATEGGSAVDITTAYADVSFAKESISTLTAPSAASLPADAPAATAVDPGTAVLA